ncbi:type II and III secretion system protein family protein [Ralstonia mannitolilytica]|uniref:type II and III secretion system protein family protein n=1 Tax=Ralstonia mannitolilytica TaxID=105219 RepID=UPI0009ECDE9C|nr:pilus assembly protein N-terminal domain-containing protein [Ralstonia mannitolilytica]CAJ0890888.1 Type 3 secretion system secretin [Ralstonia mannitolilytica]
MSTITKCKRAGLVMLLSALFPGGIASAQAQTGKVLGAGPNWANFGKPANNGLSTDGGAQLTTGSGAVLQNGTAEPKPQMVAVATNAPVGFDRAMQRVAQDYVAADSATLGAQIAADDKRRAQGKLMAQASAPAAAKGPTIVEPPAASAPSTLAKPARAVKLPPGRHIDGPAEAIPRAISLYPGEVRVLNLRGVTRVAIGSGKIASATIVEDRQIVLLGEMAGTTSVHVWLRNGRDFDISLTVTADAVGNTLANINSMLAGTKVVAVQMGDRIVLTGNYDTDETVQRVDLVKRAYPTLIDQVPPRPLDRKIYNEKLIRLDVKLVEVKKNALDNMGIKWAESMSGPTFATSGFFYANSLFRGTAQSDFPVTTAAKPFVSYFGIATQLTSMINLLEETGAGWVLAEPRLSAQSGGKANFVAGGEIPIPVAGPFGQTQVVYKTYGVILNFEPVADDAGNVSSHVSAEVSDIDTAHSSAGMPAFTQHKTETDVTLRENETLVISGLLKNTGNKTLDQIPFLGDIPVLGELFRNRQFRNEQTELVVMVTPRIVKAIQARDNMTNEDDVKRGYEVIDNVHQLVQKRMAK